MRKAVNLIIIMLAVLLAAPIGAAFASQGQDQLVYEQFGTGSWATWYQVEKGWDHGKPDDGKTYTTDPHRYQLPAEKLKNCKLTQIEVKTGYGFDANVFEKAGGWQRIARYDDYNDEILRYAPDGLSVADTHDLATGKVDVAWSLKLNPTRWEKGREARVTVDPSVRAKLRELGFNLEDDKTYDTAEQGWLWCLPVHIQWYGIPQQAPDFSVRFHEHEFKDVKPGQGIKSKVTYKLNADHPQPETAKLELYHAIGGKEWPITPPNGDFIEFQPGEERTFDYEILVQAGSTHLEAVIRPASTDQDRDWSNNRDRANIAAGVDIAVSAAMLNTKYTIPWNRNSVSPKAQVVVTRKDAGGPVDVKLTMNGPAGVKTETFPLEAGKKRTFQYQFTASAAGTYTVKAEAWPVGAEDTYPADNRASCQTRVEKLQAPPKTGSDGEDIRVGLGG